MSWVLQPSHLNCPGAVFSFDRVFPASWFLHPFGCVCLYTCPGYCAALFLLLPFNLFLSCLLVTMARDSCPSSQCPGCPHSKPHAFSIPLLPHSLLVIKPGLSSGASCCFLASISCLLPYHLPSVSPASPSSCSVFWCSCPVLA